MGHPVRVDQPWADRLLDDDPDYFADRFWADGMVRVSGREYNGVVESPCSASESFGCLSCHQMHGADPDDQLAGEDPDASCRGCHPSVAAGGREHTHHGPSSSGSRCVNCHMPHTTYGLLKAIRSHEISSPRITDSVEVGRPDACSLCHVDRTLGWTADALTRWYGQPPLRATTHETTPIDSSSEAAAVAWLLAGDAGQRALAAWHLSWGPALEASGGASWPAMLLAELLDDPYPAVRWVAYRSLRRMPGFSDLDLGDLEQVDRETVRRVQAMWTPPPVPTWRPEVPAGRDEAARSRVGQLRRHRDDRPMALAE